eukprot:TRINITY_DN15831_c0_g1_i1.p1 TRINITY_DN15831_c0_g1~~TRINITY_DN15831_c0_g1_i1.p1  ORF type:complete len:397 (+),score=62.15 TRINITY_DN15831_c0_g1_i1:90-1280(+)
MATEGFLNLRQLAEDSEFQVVGLPSSDGGPAVSKLDDDPPGSCGTKAAENVQGPPSRQPSKGAYARELMRDSPAPVGFRRSIAPSTKNFIFTPSGHTGLFQSLQKRKAKLQQNVDAKELKARIDRHHGPWMENPTAFEMMKDIRIESVMPVLQQRLTQYHGTRVPIVIIFMLRTTEVGRLTTVDKFWRRSVSDAMIWQGLYCRDYAVSVGQVCPANKRCGLYCRGRCVWKTLNGRQGTEKCLYHMGGINEKAYLSICRRLTAIPGRSKEELLESYAIWRERLRQLEVSTEDGDNDGEEAADEGNASALAATQQCGKLGKEPRRRLSSPLLEERPQRLTSPPPPFRIKGGILPRPPGSAGQADSMWIAEAPGPILAGPPPAPPEEPKPRGRRPLSKV